MMFAISAIDRKDVKSTIDCLDQLANVIAILREALNLKGGE